MYPFGELLEKLARSEVRYVLVGGGAVLLHGYAHVTADLDILIEANEENARRLIAALATWGEGAGQELSVEELTSLQVGWLRVVEDFWLDVFTLMPARRLERNFSYAELAEDALRRDIGGGVEVLYASIERLIELKADTGRPKDLADVMILTEIARGQREPTQIDLAAMQPDSTLTRGGSEQGNWPLPPAGK